MKTLTIIFICLLFGGCKGPNEFAHVVDVSNDFFVAKTVSPLVEDTTKPIILFVPGSGGSFIKDESLFGFSKDGFHIVSIAYFGQKKLPQQIEKVPLEYLDSIVKWTRRTYKGRKIVLLGISKGAEYGLSLIHI